MFLVQTSYRTFITASFVFQQHIDMQHQQPEGFNKSGIRTFLCLHYLLQWYLFALCWAVLSDIYVTLIDWIYSRCLLLAFWFFQGNWKRFLSIHIANQRRKGTDATIGFWGASTWMFKGCICYCLEKHAGFFPVFISLLIKAQLEMHCLDGSTY